MLQTAGLGFIESGKMESARCQRIFRVYCRLFRNYIKEDDFLIFMTEKKAKTAFDMFDLDGSGKITQTEVHDVVLQIFTCVLIDSLKNNTCLTPWPLKILQPIKWNFTGLRFCRTVALINLG